MVKLEISSAYSLPGTAINGSKLDGQIIIAIICNFYKINKSKLSANNRQKPLPDIRKVVCYFLRNYTSITTTDIGKIIGCNHTLVSYNLKWINERRKFKKMQIIQDLEILEKLIK